MNKMTVPKKLSISGAKEEILDAIDLHLLSKYEKGSLNFEKDLNGLMTQRNRVAKFFGYPTLAWSELLKTMVGE